MQIAGRAIGDEYSPYIIAEISANHNGSLDTALEIIDAAAAAGADAVKLQTYTPDTLTIDCDLDDFQIKGGLWDGRSLYDLYSEAHTPWNWHKDLFDRAAGHGLTVFSSAFDTTAVDFLMDLNTPAFKIASFEAVDLPLIRYVASTKKPMIISTGMADDEEIAEAVQAARDGGCRELILLHCVSGYPAPAEDYNMRTIPDMAKKFGVPVGLSDHTLDNTAAIVAVALGAVAIEKHFTLDRNGGGPDDSFSLEPAEFTELCASAKLAWSSLGKIDYGRKSSEIGNVTFRRSLYAVADIAAGDEITAQNVRSIRPGFGMPPKHLDKILGRRTRTAILRGTPIRWDQLV